MKENNLLKHMKLGPRDGMLALTAVKCTVRFQLLICQNVIESSQTKAGCQHLISILCHGRVIGGVSYVEDNKTAIQTLLARFFIIFLEVLWGKV